MALALLMLATEAWVRFAWNPLRGQPGFYASDAMAGRKLTANYVGWFAGVPVRINNLGFRDDRDYDLKKGPDTFRMLVLGDSVTFGHGSLYEHTYPRLLEEQLRAWRPEIDWQVWNLGVPGYNTSQELAQLREWGPRFNPDLVVVGFYDNDLVGNTFVRPPGRAAVLFSGAMSWLGRHAYSLELYKRIYLELAWRLSSSDALSRRIVALNDDSSMLSRVESVSALKEQQLTAHERLTDAQVAQIDCVYGEQPEPDLIDDVMRDSGWPPWLAAVQGFGELRRQGAYPIVGFLNIVPKVCPDGDVYYPVMAAFNRFISQTFETAGVPTFSVHDTFLYRRPSQMPAAAGHALGNSNLTKAEALFAFLRDKILPPLIQPR